MKIDDLFGCVIEMKFHPKSKFNFSVDIDGIRYITKLSNEEISRLKQNCKNILAAIKDKESQCSF